MGGPRTYDAKKLRIALLRAELEVPEGESVDPIKVLRPKTRGDCENGIRPCPFASCKHNLYLEVSAKGALKLNFPDLEPDEMIPNESCVLDVVTEQGAQSLYAVGRLLNVTRERARQLEDLALANVDQAVRRELVDFTER